MELIIILILGIPMAIIIGAIVIVALWITKRGSTSQAKETRAQESRMIQEIYRGLSNLEKRVESLETIIIDEAAKVKET